MRGSVLDKQNARELVLFSDKAHLILSKNVNSQADTYSCSENPHPVHAVPQLGRAEIQCAAHVCDIKGLMLLNKTMNSHYI
jgi:hypothetical protein